MAPPRVLVFSSLFPSTARPRHGIFVETRLAQLKRECEVDARVIAPVPWFPSRAQMFGEYARFAATPRHAQRAGGVPVSHPRYLMLPRVGMALQPDSMARAALADVRALQAEGWTPDIIDAHYFYPDGVAAARLAEQLDVPFVVTARGSDINLIAKMPAPRRRIVEAAARAAAVIAVSTPLKQALVELGVDENKVVVLRNGVDTEVFRVEDRAESRRQLGLPVQGPLALCVGNLVPEKGQALAIEVLRHQPALRLAIVGEGPLRVELEQLAAQHGVRERVSFLANMPQQQLRHAYAAADVLLLTSTREGWPNVVLESLACGTPVLATDVGAVREMLTVPQAGRVVEGREAAAVAAGVAALLQAQPDRGAVRRHAERFDWASIARGQMDVFARAIAGYRHARNTAAWRSASTA